MLPGFEMCCTRPVEYSHPSMHGEPIHGWVRAFLDPTFRELPQPLMNFLPVDERFDMSQSRYFLVLDLEPRDSRFQVSHS